VPLETPQLSVIIPAHNAGETIVQVLETLLSGTGDRVEIIVVDDASTDDTASLVQRFPVTLISRPQCGGPSAARNQGVEVAQGEILVFIDADVQVRSDTLERIRAYLAGHPETAAVFGSYDTAPAGFGFISRFRNLMHHFVHQQGRLEASTFWCGCGAVRRRAYQDVGGLSEALARPSIEDIEFGARLHHAGHRIHLLKEIQVTHLKQWGLWQMMRTDVRDRAIPWTMLLLEGRCRSDELNLQGRHRVSAAMVILGLAALAAAIFIHPIFLLGVAGSALVFHLVNRDLLRFFNHTGGIGFALAALPLVLLFYIYSSIGFGAGLLFYLIGKRLG
jgi:cellulose synthase/poly-beta-1,6-N-acetylglucosamine synthase-like glycosyltransferase